MAAPSSIACPACRARSAFAVLSDGMRAAIHHPFQLHCAVLAMPVSSTPTAFAPYVSASERKRYETAASIPSRAPRVPTPCGLGRPQRDENHRREHTRGREEAERRAPRFARASRWLTQPITMPGQESRAICCTMSRAPENPSAVRREWSAGPAARRWRRQCRSA